ncbi:hypothetical protein BDY19DRAFT_910563 [Irpex rosettiformis]|uniref:Uncharacterized protein n=1 Tax=Irpex rosettiformis TaxID=378272 RepID=A0ACB8TNB6_9APHY|nr:hypothetical protein BDY19DRAFT_910563 [Irpex rosettiformis]
MTIFSRSRYGHARGARRNIHSFERPYPRLPETMSLGKAIYTKCRVHGTQVEVFWGMSISVNSGSAASRDIALADIHKSHSHLDDVESSQIPSYLRVSLIGLLGTPLAAPTPLPRPSPYYDYRISQFMVPRISTTYTLLLLGTILGQQTDYDEAMYIRMDVLWSLSPQTSTMTSCYLELYSVSCYLYCARSKQQFQTIEFVRFGQLWQCMRQIYIEKRPFPRVFDKVMGSGSLSLNVQTTWAIQVFGDDQVQWTYN